MLDEHCHILWGVDDGARSFEESRAMLDAARACGITGIVCTPHLRWDSFDAARVLERFEQLRQAAPDLDLTLGYEVYYDRLLRMKVHRAPEFVTQNTNAILIEFKSGGEVPDSWQRIFYTLQTKYGLDITLAHPERYLDVLDDFDTVYRFADMGCRMQVSAPDLFRGPFDKVSRCARRIIREGLCDALVSDAHCPEDYRAFAKAQAKWADLLPA